MAAVDRLEIDDLKGAMRELRKVDAALPKEVQRLNKSAVGPMAEDARSRYRALHGGGDGSSERTIRPLATQRQASLAIGSKREPHLIGHEFGSDIFPQFPSPTKPGYFLYPAAVAGMDELEDSYLDALEKITHRAFPHRRR